MTASPTPFFAESAGEPDHSPDAGNMVSTCAENAQVQPASAAGQSEEEIARLIDPERFRSHDSVRSYSIREGYGEEEAQLRADWFHPLAGPLEKARAALALFAPILAEKEREYELASEGRAAFAARALAAEAALAAEREKVAQVLEPFDDALGEDDEGYGDGLTVVMKWGACTDYSVTLADLRDVRKLAAAIRAQKQP